MKPKNVREEDWAAAGYLNPIWPVTLDENTTKAYSAGLRHSKGRKDKAVESAIFYLQQEWPSVVRKIEADAITLGIESLILAFRRYCIFRWNVEVSVTEFRHILTMATDIRADLDHADEVGVPSENRHFAREVLHPPAEDFSND